ncbi:MAG TPA: acyl-CoA dehydrogenase family protein [Pseudonocardiaceae bacterium]|jgi:acyl-CoA dehydrogenase|nr:acyl-CoA dehydrogenase family protein [Pseudonocardiaceae bacterium]
MARSAWLTEDLDAFRDLARSFCEKELLPNQDRWMEQKHVDRDLWQRAGEVGLLCLSMPEEYGGGGGTFAHEIVLMEEQIKVGDGCWGVSLHNGIVAPYLLHYGTEDQRKHWLPKLASGELVGAIAMTEPGTGSDLQNIKSRAVRDGDDYVLNGAKTFITNGGQADLVIVAAKTDSSQGSHGVSLLLVEADSPGFRRGRILDKVGLKGQDTAELFFDDVRVPAANVLGGAEGQGFVQLMQQLPQERLIIAITATCVMEAAIEQTVRYTKERTAFGREVFKFQNTRFTLAECATEATVCRAFVDQCIEAHLRGELDVPTAAKAKWWCSDRACRVVDECVQLHGGYGYMNEYPIARAWTDIRVQRIYGGTNEIMKEIISRTL